LPAPEDDLHLLEEAARQVGPIAMRFWRRDPQIWDKADNAGPVTEADLAVNAHLEGFLRAARPDYGWLSEESEADPSRLDAKNCFIIDPIDGTRAFIDGQEGFSHSLAIATDGRITAAAVYLPARDMLYTAHAEGPALLNGAPIAVSTRSQMQDATVLTYRAATEPQHWAGGRVPGFRREFRPSLAWRLCLVAEGRFDAALSLRAAWEWDIAAGTLIAARAGAATTDRQGKPLSFNSPRAATDGMIVAGPALHRQLADSLTRD
jgi:myo-inositol-1(or 4)-monophosphatase